MDIELPVHSVYPADVNSVQFSLSTRLNTHLLTRATPLFTLAEMTVVCNEMFYANLCVSNRAVYIHYVFMFVHIRPCL